MHSVASQVPVADKVCTQGNGRLDMPTKDPTVHFSAIGLYQGLDSRTLILDKGKFPILTSFCITGHCAVIQVPIDFWLNAIFTAVDNIPRRRGT